LELAVLFLSIIALFIGPLLYQWLRRGGFVAKAFDSLIIAVLVVMMVFLLIPESWAELGYLSVAMMLTGYLVPGLLENLVKKAAHTFHLISLLLALAGLALHAMLDGAALTVGSGGATTNLSLAIVLHRFGVGMMLWLMVQPALGKRLAFAVLGFVALATVAGYLLSGIVLGLEGVYAPPVIQALIIGMIVHSLVHRSHGAGHDH
jgi:hypothetical protein